MSVKKSLTNRLKTSIFAVIFAVLGFFGLTTTINVLTSSVNQVYAEPVPTATASDTVLIADNTETTLIADNTDGAVTDAASDNSASENTDNAETCYDQVGALGWFICPGTGVLSKAIDSIYEQIEKLLVVNPISTDGTSPIFQIWQIMRDITNIVFVIVLLIIIYSQITGIGISNYGLKKALPKLIIAAVLVNLSYIICAIGVDVSNIIGANIQGLFENIQLQAMSVGGMEGASGITWTQLTGALIGGGAIAGLGIAVAGGIGALLWPLLGALLCAIISVLVGLLTLGLRQALISILIMIAPLAIVCYLLPNTEKWFGKWKDLFISMLFFYPMFSLLYGASQLAGWALIVTSVANGSMFGIVVGMAVQVLPLILSISLMKMSGTILGKVSSGLDRLTSKPKDAIRAATGQYRDLARNRHVNNSILPSAHLQRFLDGQKRKQEIESENATRIRRSNAEIWAQRYILGSQKYDPAYLKEYQTGKDEKGNKSSHRLKTTASTRDAKQAMNLELAAQTAAKDTTHVLSNYGSYHHATNYDKKLDNSSAKSYLDFYRSNLAEQNDAFADEDFVMGRYNEFRDAFETDENGKLKYDKNGDLILKGKDELRGYNYKHYVVGAAGALGEKGELTVLGEVISKSAANEAKRKAYVNYAFAKYGYNKRDFRNMVVGYYNDDDGYAVDPKTNEHLLFKDKNGKLREELFPGELFYYYPEKLKPAAYDKYEIINGKKEYYYDATDQQGKFIGRIYKSDTPAMKEILQEWDMPIADPINGLYGMLSGIYQGDYSKYGLDGIGLASLSTTIGRAMVSSGFKEKASYAGPMYATSVSQRLIKNPVHQHLAILDNLIKTAKPSGFNTQDYAALNTLALLMDESNWDEMLFDRKALETYANVNNEKLKVTRKFIDERGKQQEMIIDPKDATDQELKEAVVGKFINKAVPKFFNLMSRTTPNIIDNQKPSSQDSWKQLLQNMLLLTDNETVRELMTDETKQKAAKLKRLSQKYSNYKEPIDSNSGDTLNLANSLKFAISPRLNKRLRENEEHANSTEFKVKGQKSDKPIPYDQTDEGKALDEEYREFEQAQRESGIGEENSSDYLNQVDLIAAENSDSPELFIDAVREFLDNLYETDYRIRHVIDDFEGYLPFNKNATVEDMANYIKDRIIDYTF